MENEDEYAIALLRRLDDEPSTPSRVDLGRAIVEGGRRRRTRRALGGGSAVVLVAAMVATVPVALTALRPEPSVPKNQAADVVASATPAAARPAPPASPTGCSVQRLPLPNKEPMSLVTGADPTGRFIAGRTYPKQRQGSYPILIWDNGVPHQIVLPGADQSLSDINSAGVAVGSGWLDDGQHAYVYRDGKVSPLPAKGTSQARAINDAGQIVGTRDDAGDSKPIRWPSASAQPVDLPLPGADWTGQVTGIDEDGTMVGLLTAGRHDGEQIAPGATDDPARAKSLARSGGLRAVGYLWLPDGSMRELPRPTVAGLPVDEFRPKSIRNGWITGTAVRYDDAGDLKMTAVRYHLSTNEFVDFPTGSFAPEDGNGSGWVGGTLPDGRLALMTDTMMVELPFIEPHELMSGDRVLTVSDDGRTIAGQSEDADNVIQAVVWNCR